MGRVRSVELFPTDGPIAPDRMIGRRGDLTDLVGQLGNGVNRVLAGPRRTGKTTVAHGALEQLKRSGSYTVAVDLFRVADQAELAERVVDEVIANRSILRRAARATRTAGRAALTSAQVAATVKARSELGDSIEIAYSPGLAAGDPSRHLAGAFEMLQRIAEADRRQVVLFIDEFQEIAGPRAPFGDPDQLTKRMRAILTRSDRVTCLFAGSVEHLLKGLFNDKRRALYQFGGFVSLGPIDPDEWRTGLITRLTMDDTTIRDEAMARLLDHSEGHPRATMLIAQQTHVAAVAAGVHDLDLDLVEVGYATALAGEHVNHTQTIERIRALSKHTFPAARAIARGESPYSVLDAASASRSVEALRDAGLIVIPSRGQWRIEDPLLRRYLADPASR